MLKCRPTSRRIYRQTEVCKGDGWERRHRSGNNVTILCSSFEGSKHSFLKYNGFWVKKTLLYIYLCTCICPFCIAFCDALLDELFPAADIHCTCYVISNIMLYDITYYKLYNGLYILQVVQRRWFHHYSFIRVLKHALHAFTHIVTPSSWNHNITILRVTITLSVGFPSHCGSRIAAQAISKVYLLWSDGFVISFLFTWESSRSITNVDKRWRCFRMSKSNKNEVCMVYI